MKNLSQWPRQQLVLLAVLALSGAGSARAIDLGLAERFSGQDLAIRHGCVGYCHPDKEDKSHLLGPSMGDIAAKYRDNEEAPLLLQNNVANGSSGTWAKDNTMLPQISVPKADLKKIIDWILSL